MRHEIISMIHNLSEYEKNKLGVNGLFKELQGILYRHVFGHIKPMERVARARAANFNGRSLSYFWS